VSGDIDPRFYIYPLKADSGYVLGDNHPTNLDGFKGAVSFPHDDEWRLSNGYRKVQPGDWIWAYFSKPDRRIGAIGEVRTTPDWNSDWGCYSINIRWFSDLTKRLWSDPIYYDDYKQQVRGAVVEATPNTYKIFRRWLRGKQTKASESRSREVLKVRREVQQRLGQQQFRQDLMRAYNSTCAITGTTVPGTLEAAHIKPVSAGGTHSLSNGLLLRADIHNLFDQGLITIKSNGRINVHPSLKGTEYSKLGRRTATVPRSKASRPSNKMIQYHREMWLG